MNFTHVHVHVQLLLLFSFVLIPRRCHYHFTLYVACVYVLKTQNKDFHLQFSIFICWKFSKRNHSKYPQKMARTYIFRRVQTHTCACSRISKTIFVFSHQFCEDITDVSWFQYAYIKSACVCPTPRYTYSITQNKNTLGYRVYRVLPYEWNEMKWIRIRRSKNGNINTNCWRLSLHSVARRVYNVSRSHAKIVVNRYSRRHHRRRHHTLPECRTQLRNSSCIKCANIIFFSPFGGCLGALITHSNVPQTVCRQSQVEACKTDVSLAKFRSPFFHCFSF